MTRYSVLLAVAVIVGLASEVVGQGPGGPIAVKVAPVESKTITDEVSFIGTLEPNITTTASAVVSGRVIKADFREGDRVEAGKTVLIELDRTRREIAFREQQAVVARAREQWEKMKQGFRAEEVAQRAAEAKEQEALLARAEKDFGRAKQLYKDQLISLAEFQKSESDTLAAREKYKIASAALQLAHAGTRTEDIAMAEAEHEQAKASLDAVAYELSRSTLRAPITGFVVKKHVDVGNWVEPGQSVADVIDLDPVFATGPVSERKIGLLKPGLPATVSLDAFPGEVFTGQVARIVPQADRQSRTFPVKIRLGNPDGKLRAGMLARIVVRLENERPSVLVPKDAVVRRGIDEVVFVVDSGKAREVKVRTGRALGGLLEISRGDLAPGQPVVVLGNEGLRDGVSVVSVNGTGPGENTEPK
jgi:HlyD family secretion protein